MSPIVGFRGAIYSRQNDYDCFLIYSKSRVLRENNNRQSLHWNIGHMEAHPLFIKRSSLQQPQKARSDLFVACLGNISLGFDCRTGNIQGTSLWSRRAFLSKHPDRLFLVWWWSWVICSFYSQLLSQAAMLPAGSFAYTNVEAFPYKICACTCRQ